MTELPALTYDLRRIQNDEALSALSNGFCNFLDIITTGTNRATHYNTKEEQIQAITAAHEAICGVDRGVYGAALMLPGVTDFSIQTGIANMILHGRDGESILPLAVETAIVQHLNGKLPPQRQLKLYVSMAKGKINNSRTRKLIATTILEQKGLDWRAVKYRQKMRIGLTHVVGQRRASILRSICSKSFLKWTDKETQIFADFTGLQTISAEMAEAVGFILGSEKEKWQTPLFKKYEDAKKDLSKGEGLPYEVLEGIRSVYHPNAEKTKVLDLTKETLTQNQKMVFQRKAAKEGVEVEFDPRKYDAVKLYLYAYEQGMTQEIFSALDEKAVETARSFPFRYESLAVVVDGSKSMYGDASQPLRPMALAMAMSSALEHCADSVEMIPTGGNLSGNSLIYPQGETDLATATLRALAFNPEAVFVITDGYENAPAGRFHEVMEILKQNGVQTPIYQYSPVMGAETMGTRQLSSYVPVTPFSDPRAIGMGAIKALFQTDPLNGVKGLLGMVMPRIESAR